ncbi:MAG: alpha/beta fold hydrolase BchO, partial [Pseudomonadota bacterium]
EGWHPVAVIGHSAGAALALRLAETGLGEAVIGINAALGKFEGAAGWAFPLAANLLALNPFTALAFSTASSSPLAVRQILRSTGSRIDAETLKQYQNLVASPRHVDGTLRMMAAWNLAPLIARLPRNPARTTLLAGQRDRTVPPRVAHEAAARMPNARVIELPDLGHLAHEEAPEEVAAQILAVLAEEAVSR